MQSDESSGVCSRENKSDSSNYISSLLKIEKIRGKSAINTLYMDVLLSNFPITL